MVSCIASKNFCGHVHLPPDVDVGLIDLELKLKVASSRGVKSAHLDVGLDELDELELKLKVASSRVNA